jgi:hypothetical protein
LFSFSIDVENEVLRIDLPDLIEVPVLDFEHDQAVFLRIQDEIRLPSLHIRQVPADKPVVRLGDGFQKTVSLPSTFGGKLLDTLWKHGGYEK